MVLGGTYPTFYSQILNNECVDAIITGEAEGAALDICNALAGNGDFSDIANVGYISCGKPVFNQMRPLVDDLDSLPLPDRELYFKYSFMRDFGWKKFMSGRGCYHSCAYCYNPKIREQYRGLGSYVRRKSPQRVIDEIDDVVRRSRVSAVHFCDDLFISDDDWIREFCAIYKQQVTIPFTCNSSVDLITRDSVKALSGAGCRGIAVGLETGDESARHLIMNKCITDDQIIEASGLIRSFGVKLITFNMIGNPGETLENALKTMELNRRINSDFIRVTFAIPIPGTQYVDYALNIGAIDEKYSRIIPDISDLARKGVAPVYKTAHRRQLINLYYLFAIGAKNRFLYGLARCLVRLPLTPFFRLLGLHRLFSEKKLFGLGLVECIRYYLHVGSPYKRTTNFASLI
ncbi:B12-binding domain-containing radical SAM protein [Elusimicrobiota bacterium]